MLGVLLNLLTATAVLGLPQQLPPDPPSNPRKKAVCQDDTFPVCTGACASGGDAILFADERGHSCSDDSTPDLNKCLCADGSKYVDPNKDWVPVAGAMARIFKRRSTTKAPKRIKATKGPAQSNSTTSPSKMKGSSVQAPAETSKVSAQAQTEASLPLKDASVLESSKNPLMSAKEAGKITLTSPQESTQSRRELPQQSKETATLKADKKEIETKSLDKLIANKEPVIPVPPNKMLDVTTKNPVSSNIEPGPILSRAS